MASQPPEPASALHVLQRKRQLALQHLAAAVAGQVELERAGVRLRQPAVRRRRAAGRFLLVEGDLVVVREAAGRQ